MDSLPLDSSITASTGAPPSSPQTQTLRQQIVESLSQPPTANDPATIAVSKEALEEGVDRINETLRSRGLEFEVSEEFSRVITRVIDRETGDVIRQIPGEEVLAVVKRLEEMQSGLVSLEA